MEPLLTICMPSNRLFSSMEPSLLSALNFCEASKSQLILSNNSFDKKKENALNKFKLPYFKHLKGPQVGIDNWQHAVSQSQSLYTLILCDDDMIFNLAKPRFNSYYIVFFCMI